ncbi:MAG: hypothetical protein HY561_05470 [Gemmatimonadetes bacterium]|nr:hypothetical protein [Gemmatimonadota bacterium]
MSKARSPAVEPPVGDAAVRAKTGKSWAEWLDVLDAAGAAKMGHRAIVEHVAERYGVPGWWAQTVTVGYERARGLREKHQTATGFSANASKTVATPVARLYAAWAEGSLRRRWLGAAKFTIRKATPSTSLRITWGDGSDIEVLFSAKGAGKSQVTVQSRRLADAAAVTRTKAFWKKRLDRLEELLEGS